MKDSIRSRLVVVPSDPIAAYERAGYDSSLEGYYNPQKMFRDVFAISPLEKGERKAYGMTILGVSEAEFSRTLRDIRPAVVRAYGGFWPADLACRHRIPGVPVVVSVHDTNRSLLHKSVRYADLVICMSEAVEKQVLAMGVDQTRIRILPNRIDTNVFYPIKDQTLLQAVARRFPAGKHILHVGRKSHQKNLDTLILALEFLPSDYSCVFVGLGDSSSYMSLAEKVRAKERCFWVESVKNAELPLWYSWCDCFCVPSRWEGFGIVFIEAAACGAPIVTSDIAPMNEYLTTDVSACLVQEYESPRALADAIRRVCEDTEYRRTISAGAIKAAQPFDRCLVDVAEVALYREAMSMGSPPLSRRVETSIWRVRETVAASVRAVLARRLVRAVWRWVRRIVRSAKGLVSKTKFDKLYGLLRFGFLIPPFDGMQNFAGMRFLYNSILEYAQCTSGLALEVGCYNGCSTVFLAKACIKKGIKEIYSIDLFTGTPSWNQTFDTFEFASDRMRKYNLQHNVTLIRSHSLAYNWRKQIDVLHLDADHSYEAVVQDIKKYAPFITDGGIIIYDDYDTTHPGVRKAVHEFVLMREDFEIIGVHYEGLEHGIICLRKRGSIP